MLDPVSLSESECERLLRADVVGRLGFSTPDGPLVLPLNYAVVHSAVVALVEPGGAVARHAVGADVAFEVDQIDHQRQRGWSVLAHGRADLVTDPADLALIARTWAPRPWAAGDRSQVVRIPWRLLTGRRLGRGWDAADDLPVSQVLKA
ncbi:MAG: pyridoxamine 5'-phosphate oxidase family protein [Nocardioides sp.]